MLHSSVILFFLLVACLSTLNIVQAKILVIF